MSVLHPDFEIIIQLFHHEKISSLHAKITCRTDPGSTKSFSWSFKSNTFLNVFIFFAGWFLLLCILYQLGFQCHLSCVCLLDFLGCTSALGDLVVETKTRVGFGACWESFIVHIICSDRKTDAINSIAYKDLRGLLYG